MVFERRAFLFAMTAMLAGCARATPGQAESRDGGAAAPRKRIDGWEPFRSAFLDPGGRIVDTGNGGISHSEGQGYGMLLAEAAGDRPAFDRIHQWAEAKLLRPYEALFSWRYDPRKPIPVDDPNNASDGDMLIAWALTRAGERWGDKAYLDRAADIRGALAANVVKRLGKRTLLLPGITGFEQPDRLTVNLSYYIWPALDAFRAADGGVWDAVVRDGEWLTGAARHGPLRLPTDWTDVSAAGAVTPAGDKPARFGFDAVRVPLYLMLGGRQAAAEPVARFWRTYADMGAPVPAWVDVASGEVAPYPLSAGGYAIAQRLLGRTLAFDRPAAVDYYSAVLEMLTKL